MQRNRYNIPIFINYRFNINCIKLVNIPIVNDIKYYPMINCIHHWYYSKNYINKHRRVDINIFGIIIWKRINLIYL
jgi:hypothetical protein